MGAPPWTCLTWRRRLIGMLPIECRPDAAVSWRRRMVGWSRDRTMGGSLQLAQGEARFGRVFVSPRMNSRGLGVAPAAWGRGLGNAKLGNLSQERSLDGEPWRWTVSGRSVFEPKQRNSGGGSGRRKRLSDGLVDHARPSMGIAQCQGRRGRSTRHLRADHWLLSL